MNKNDPLLDYYYQELNYLREAGKHFAQKYPKIARRLDLSEHESRDPHVERLIESFAFLSGKLSKEISDRIPQISTAFLDSLYPQLVAPVPSFSIAKFNVDFSKSILPEGVLVPKGSSLYAAAEEGHTCRFTTVYDLKLYPFQVTQAEVVEGAYYNLQNKGKANWYIRLRLESPLVPFNKFDIQNLHFHIDGDRLTKFNIYEAIFTNNNPQAFVAYDDKSLEGIDAVPLSEMGFNDDELALPKAEQTHLAYNLIQEYLCFPEKFLFFKFKSFQITRPVHHIDILIPIAKGELAGQLKLSSENFLGGCTPIINLFEKVTDPLRLDHQQTFYRIVADHRLQKSHEIHSIKKVLSVQSDQNEPQEIPHYFSYDRHAALSNKTSFWFARRYHAQDKAGTDTEIGFIDLDFNPAHGDLQTIYAHTLSTNRNLASQLPAKAKLDVDFHLPTKSIYCLEKPTKQVFTASESQSLWRLIMQLTNNHLFVTSGKDSIRLLKSVLNLYNPDQNFQETEALLDIEYRESIHRMGQEGWRGFIRGLSLNLVVNDQLLSDRSIFLLTSVLRHFFSLQVSVNSFIQTELTYMSKPGKWMVWKPLTGLQQKL